MKLPNIWVHVPPGKLNDEVAPKRLQVADVPIKYQQGEKPLCFRKSMASALFYIDLKQASGDVNSIASHFSNKPLNDACSFLQEFMKNMYQLLVLDSLIIITNGEESQETKKEGNKTDH